MISIKKYLEATTTQGSYCKAPADDIAQLSIAAYRSALQEMGHCSLEACSSIGNGLKNRLDEIGLRLAQPVDAKLLSDAEREVREQLGNWGRAVEHHYQQTSNEVKDLLIAMVQTAESVGARDARCAGQINEVTARLAAVANLDDLTEIRASIKQSAAELKNSIDRMTAEGKAAMDRLREQVSNYRNKLEEAEEIASHDALTGLRNRVYVERQIECRIAAGETISVAIVDIDDFKKVNDELGHLAGDELLKQFATELVSASLSGNIIGRWGGDEFILAFACNFEEASEQAEHLQQWICGNYAVEGISGQERLCVTASIGLAEHQPGESMKNLVARADASMYSHKSKQKPRETTSISPPSTASA